MLFTIYSLFELQTNKTPFMPARFSNQVTAGHLPLPANEWFMVYFLMQYGLFNNHYMHVSLHYRV